jgi:hypothetical protein
VGELGARRDEMIIASLGSTCCPATLAEPGTGRDCCWRARVVVDEAHRMSAHYFGPELKTTKRYQLGQLPALLAQTREQVCARAGQTRRLVRQRLTQEINYWDARHAELLEAEAAGRQLKIRPETAFRRARDLERRLERRLTDLARDEDLMAKPPVVAGAALVIPQGLLDRLLGRKPEPPAGDTAQTDRRAVAAVLTAERSLGRDPQEMPHNNPGYDIRSTTKDGHLVFIEVKGRVTGGEEFWVTKTEALTGKNAAASYRLALVSIHPEGPHRDEARYIADPFRDVDFGDFTATGMSGHWAKEWARAGDPL